MTIEALTNLFVNNGVAIAVIIFFCCKDWKFTNQLLTAITGIQKIIERMESDNDMNRFYDDMEALINKREESTAPVAETTTKVVKAKKIKAKEVTEPEEVTELGEKGE